jgi:hypothetical protein
MGGEYVLLPVVHLRTTGLWPPLVIEKLKGSEMPDDDRELAQKWFIAELNTIWMAAGPPSFAEFEILSAKLAQPLPPSGLRMVVLTHSTTQRILAGQGRTLPKWQWIASFVTVLRAVAARNGVDQECLGTLEEWKAKHAKAVAAIRRTKDHDGQDADDEAASDGLAMPSAAVNRRQAGAGVLTTLADGPLLIHADSERARRASVLALVRRVRTLGWWQDYRDVVPDWFEIYLSLEPAATLIRTYETEFIPDLLQTEEYADAAVRLETDDMPAADVRRRVELRMVRQRILHRPDPVKLWIILDGRVLRRRVGTAATMRAQIDHLIDVSRRTNVSVQVLPDEHVPAMAGGSIAILRFSQRDLPDVAYLRQSSDALYPSEPSDMVHFGQILDSLVIEAATPEATAALLHRIRTNL